MRWQRKANRIFTRATGFEIRRVPPARQRRVTNEVRSAGAASEQKATPPPNDRSQRLLTKPVFIFSSIRSGSTLLRVLLDSHSQLHAPNELHIRSLKADESSKYVQRSMRAIGLSKKEIEHLLWDRVLDWELRKSGKQILVEKTPSSALIWRRIAECWPDARFLFLLRHPASTAQSWHAARPSWTLEKAADDVLRYMNAVDEARQNLSGLSVRYEDLTADPEAVMRQLCDFLEVPWEPRMLEYGKQSHGGFEAGLGDWTEKIRSGEIQSARPLPSPDEIPHVLHEICTSWGYMKQNSLANECSSIGSGTDI